MIDPPAEPTTSRASAAASPELTGGAGFTFEDNVAAVYAVALLCETTGPALPGRIVRRLMLQQGSLGHPLDDIVIAADGSDGVVVQASLQVKRSLTISAAPSNGPFRETVQRAHATITGATFQRAIDRVGVVTGEIADSSKRSFETLCEWARSASDIPALVKMLRTEGFAGEKQTHFDTIRSILADKVPEPELDQATHQLLSHFVLMRFDMLHEGSVTEAQTVAILASQLEPTDHPRADDLWRRLLALVRVSEGHAAVFDRKTLVARLNGAFHLLGAPSLRGALAQIAAQAKLAIADVANDISGMSIPRERFVTAARAALAQHRFVQIGGLPGTGKSVVLRSLVERDLALGPVLFLKADRLVGASWAHHASAWGLAGIPLEDLLVEIAGTGSCTLFVDGIDRVEVSHRGVVSDIFNTILDSDLLSEWRVVVTVRDTGIEPLRTWLSRFLRTHSAHLIDVTAFDDSESRLLADAVPALAKLLFGASQVQAIVRRPFFAAVLCRTHAADITAPNSEIELATAWWSGGGYAAEAARAGHRRNALVALAQVGATTLGRRIPVRGIDPDALAELEADGIIRFVRIGQTAEFVHDIYFEWSFLQLLVAEGGNWLSAIQNVGEPPVLGRIVELLSQSELKNGDNWQQHLNILEQATDVRSQWRREWIIGPLGLPGFQTQEATYNSAMLADGARRVANLAVWFQAEKTKANPLPLDSGIYPDLTPVQRLLLADSWAWPSDLDAWRRCCMWLIHHIEDIQLTTRSDVLSVFEVWQNAFADRPNRVSAEIIGLAKTWLLDIEARFHSRTFPRDRGVWDQLERGELEELEQRLRAIVLRSARANSDIVIDYLVKLQALNNIPQKAIDQVFLHGPIFSEVCPGQLADFALRCMIRPLPAEVAKRASSSAFGYQPHSENWQSLSIDDGHGFFPSAPTREPFLSLFSLCPDEGRRLVRELANHAIQAWRQLHKLDYRERGTPIPLLLNFPWEQREFWGDSQVYAWPRGSWGSHAVSSGLMALEAWGFAELAKGRPFDEVLLDILEGHTSVAAVGIASALTLDARHCSDATLPVITSQKLWSWDIARVSSQGSYMANLIGFDSRDRHYSAVSAENERASRKTDLRWLASICVLLGGELSAKASKAIMGFPDDLPFDYEEERADHALAQQLARTAEIWAEVGNRANYKATPSEDGSQVLVQIDNPKAQGADIDAINRRHAEMVDHFTLLNWVHDSFEKNAVSDRLPLEQAIQKATDLDSASLFEHQHTGASSGHERQSAVAGVAAVALRFGQGLSSSQADWATTTTLRAWQTPEAPDELFYKGSVLLHHPVLYAVRGLAALLDGQDGRDDVLDALLKLVAHGYEQISVESLGTMLKAWPMRPEIAWLALGLAVNLSIVKRPHFSATMEERAEMQAKHVVSAVENTLEQSRNLGGATQPLRTLPPAWVPIPNGPQKQRNKRGQEIVASWERSRSDLQTDLLAKVMANIPVAAAMADNLRRDLFLSWCSDLVTWTVERLHPQWVNQSDQQPFDHEASDLYEWRRSLYRFLATVSLHLDIEESIHRFVDPATRADDETFGSLAEPHVTLLTCNIMDEASYPETSMSLLQSMVPRLLSHKSWKQAEWNRGSLHDSDLVYIVRAVFFVKVASAAGATRFANGNWSEVERILPLIKPFLAAYGKNPTVTEAFVTMCERSFESFPVEAFIAQLPFVLGDQDGTPLGWRGTSLAARIASLIQRFSEKVQPLTAGFARDLLHALDRLVDMGDRRAAAIQTSEVFKDVRTGV